MRLVNLFHGRLFVIVIIVKRRQVIHVISIIVVVVVNGQTKFDEAVDTGGESGWFLQGESRCDQRGIIKKPDEVLDGLVALVSVSLVAEGSDNRVGGVDLPM